MSIRKRARAGFTLIEAMAAMGVLAFGVVGIMQMAVVTAQSTGFGGKRTLAVQLARDLVGQMDNWAFDDPRLSNTMSGNDGECTHPAGGGSTLCQVTEAMISLPNAHGLASGTDVDHDDADLTTAYLGMALPTGYERYWNVWPVDLDSNGVTESLSITVIVRFWQNGNPEDVVLTTMKVNNAEVARGGLAL